MAERFDELTSPPIKGKFYLVWCVEAKWGYPFRQGVWPVWGPKHEDEKFLSFSWVHYHLNRYFLNEEDALDARGAPLSEYDPKYPGQYPGNDPLPSPVLRRRKCLWSEAKPFPLHRATSPAWDVMYRHFQGTQCKHGNGWICPHKGFDLATIAPGPDGVIVCPLHGVRVDAASGMTLGPRTSAGREKMATMELPF